MAIHILLIEDEAQIRHNLAELLTLNGFQVETASNGREGISQALLLHPDLILCDIMMPEIDGYQVLEVIRDNRSLGNVPFIFLTARTDPADFRRGMILGADDYVTKPFTIQTLLKAIESRLQREARRKADLQVKLDAHYRTIANISAHEYNTPLSAILGFTNLLMDNFEEFDVEDTVAMLAMIKVSTLRLKRALDNIRLMDVLQYLEPGQPAYDFFSSGSTLIDEEFVESQVQAVSYRQDRELSHQIEIENAWLGISQENLRVCLEELIDNAIKFSDPDRTIRITGQIDADRYLFSVTSYGQPFKPVDSARVAPYEQFERNRYEQQGFGLGLSIVKKILALNKGRMEIKSELPEETTVTVQLPIVVQ